MSMDNLGGWGGDRSAGGRLSTLERQDPDSARNLGISVAASWLLWQSTPWFTKLEPHCCFSSLYLVDGHSLLHSVSRLGKTELKEVKSRGSDKCFVAFPGGNSWLGVFILLENLSLCIQFLLI